MGSNVNPARIHSLDDLAAAFDVLRRDEGRRLGKDRLSVQDLTRRLSRCPGDAVPRSTLANYVAGRTLPPPGPYEAILRALGVPATELTTWADAWDRLRDAGCHRVQVTSNASSPWPDLPAADVLVGSVPPTRAWRWSAWWNVATVATLVVGGVVVAVLLTSHQSAISPSTAHATEPVGECAYSPVAAPIRVRPAPTFRTGTRFQTINKVDQVVIGACVPQHGEAGTTCSAQTVPIDTWIPVRFPYTGWVFSACLERVAPPPDTTAR
jgi:hypothetical protein